ncbi:hypothetical protein DFH06DRAFT_1248177 [Mycena polygramma]|nr:hypothetical protein DFH06DRAFT_1248177 [Mycena polygramma]
MNPLTIPELLHEIAAFVRNPGGLIQLLQVDRFTNAVATPCLFRHIDITLDSVELLARTFRRTPRRAVGCRSLLFHKPCRELGDGPVSDAEEDQLYRDLIAILRTISVYGQLAALRWRCNCRLFKSKRNWVGFPEKVWTAVSSASVALRQIEFCVNSTEKLVWEWDCAHLQLMLDSLTVLEDLSLEFDDSPRGITLGTTYPHLKRFFFSGGVLFPKSDFLTLFLESEQAFRGPDGTHFPALRILSVDGDSLLSSPTVLKSPLTHLRLRYFDLDASEALDAVRAVARTLACLELEFVLLQDSFDVAHFVECMPLLLGAASALDELGLLHSPCHTPSIAASGLLVRFDFFMFPSFWPHSAP